MQNVIPTVPDAETGHPVNLLPCPFCGGAAMLEINETPDFSKVTGGAPKPASERLNFHVRCSSAPAMRCTQGKHWLDSSAERAAAAWNRRTPMPVVEGVQPEKKQPTVEGYWWTRPDPYCIWRVVEISIHGGTVYIEEMGEDGQRLLPACPWWEWAGPIAPPKAVPA